jgi:DNA-directed RNA polymerase sigma subunit (sigma70/sigma32)
MKKELNKKTCFSAHESCKKNCEQKKCRYWHEIPEHNNCIINMANKKDEYTLEEIGEIFGVTRMRICQIEKKAIEKIKIINQVFLD